MKEHNTDNTIIIKPIVEKYYTKDQVLEILQDGLFRITNPLNVEEWLDNYLFQKENESHI